VDIFENQTSACRDGTSDCPIGGTFGSWGFYVLGIFMACVFQLGPKTNYGQSEQNPAYWLQLLLATKQTGAKVTWYDPVKDQTRERNLTSMDWRTWIRFIMSFLINGVGYHILVHALPIQVASQSSLTGVVFRAVGMMYLVDLDDTPGYTLTIVEKTPEPEKEETEAPEKPKLDSDIAGTPEKIDTADAVAMSAEVEQIIEEARAKLDALASGKMTHGHGKRNATNHLLAGALLVTTPEPGQLEGDDVEGGAGEADGSRSLPSGTTKKKGGIGGAALASAGAGVGDEAYGGGDEADGGGTVEC
jgi:hypothetical protein